MIFGPFGLTVAAMIAYLRAGRRRTRAVIAAMWAVTLVLTALAPVGGVWPL